MVRAGAGTGHDDRVRSLVKLSLAWLAATAAAVALGVVAVGVVTDSVTENRPDRLSAIAVRNALTVPDASSGPETTAPPATTPSSRPAATGPPATSPPATAPAPPTTTATAPPAGAAPEDRTFQLVGGTVGVRFENGGARLLWATPKPGFRVESSGGSDEVDVRFRSGDHESRLEAFWDNGPQSEVEERED